MRYYIRLLIKLRIMTFIEEYKQLLDDDFFTAIIIAVEIPIALFIILVLFYNLILKSICWSIYFKHQDSSSIFIKVIKLIAMRK